MARKVTAAEARQAMLDVGFTAEGCLGRMEGEGMPEFAAWETLFCLLSEDGANIDHSQTEDAVWQVNGVVELYCKEGDPAFAAMALLKEHSETLTSLMDTLEAETAKHKEASAYIRCVENDLNNAMASIEHLEGEIALLRRHLEPQWTSEVPTEEGWYWVEEDNEAATPQCVYVRTDEPVAFVMFVTGRRAQLGHMGGAKWKSIQPPLPAPANQERRT